MEYDFYADVFFLTNWYLDFLAVWTAGEILGRKRKLSRCLLGCALGSLLGCILFLSLPDYDSYLLCMHFIVNPGMTVFCFFPAGKRIYGKAFLLTYFALLLLGGSVQWTYVTLARGRHYELCLAMAAVPVSLLLYILRRRREIVPMIYRVRVENGGRELELAAFFDTGNCLTDPYLSRPVHVVAPEVLAGLGGKEAFPLRLIPFSSVGRESGMLEAFTVERLTVEISGTEGTAGAEETAGTEETAGAEETAGTEETAGAEGTAKAVVDGTALREPEGFGKMAGSRTRTGERGRDGEKKSGIMEGNQGGSGRADTLAKSRGSVGRAGMLAKSRGSVGRAGMLKKGRDRAGGRKAVFSPAVLAVAEKGVFAGHPYQMILNGSIFEKIERKEEKPCT